MADKMEDVTAEKMTIAQKKDMLKNHVLHELRMFNFSLNENSKAEADEIYLQATSFENILIHARTLNEFFCGNSNYKDNVKASHFVKNASEWNKGGKKSWPAEINKRLAHISTRRLNQTDGKFWSTFEREMETDIIKSTQKFIDDLLPDFSEEKTEFELLLDYLKVFSKTTSR